MQEVGKTIKSVREGLNFAMDIIQLIKLSPKREVIFETIQFQEESPSQSGIRSLCPTRWTVCTGAMQAIISNYGALHMATSSHGTDDCSSRAAGVLALIDKFSTYFRLKLSVFIFDIIEQLSTTLQGKNSNVEDCFMAVNLCIKTLEFH